MTTLEEIGGPLFFALGCLIILGGLIGALWAPFAFGISRSTVTFERHAASRSDSQDDTEFVSESPLVQYGQVGFLSSTALLIPWTYCMKLLSGEAPSRRTVQMAYGGLYGTWLVIVGLLVVFFISSVRLSLEENPYYSTGVHRGLAVVQITWATGALVAAGFTLHMLLKQWTKGRDAAPNPMARDTCRYYLMPFRGLLLWWITHLRPCAMATSKAIQSMRAN